MVIIEFVFGIAEMLRNPIKLSNYSYFLILVPFLFSFIPDLLYPIFVANCLILIFLYYQDFFRMLNWWATTNPINKIGSASFFLGMFFSIWFFWQLGNLSISPLIIALIVFVNHYIWQGRKIVAITDFPYIPVFRSETKIIPIKINFGKITDSMVLTTVITILFIVFDSFIHSNGQTIFLVESLHWLFVIMYVGILKSVDLLIDDQIYWTLPSGMTQFRAVGMPSEFPNIDDHEEFSSYLDRISRFERPPDEFFSWFDSNIEEIVSKFSQVEYTRAFQHLVRAYSYWGKHANDKVHYLHLIVLSTLRRFRSLGIIPLYNRYTFFSYLELLYKYGYLPNDWKALITHEILNNDYAWPLGWIIGKELPQTKKEVWISFWNGHIFRGLAGYNRISPSIEQLEIPQTDHWEEDIWQLTYECLTLFIGEERGKVMGGNQSIFDAIDFLSRKGTLDSYYLYREEYQAALKQPENRFVHVEKQLANIDQNREQMERYLRGEVDQDHETGVFFELKLMARSLTESLSSANFLLLVKFIALIVIAGINLLIFDLLFNFVDQSVAQVLLVIELIILQFLTIREGQNDMLNGGRQAAEANSKTLTAAYEQVTEYPELSRYQTIALIYFFVLIFGFILIY